MNLPPDIIETLLTRASVRILQSHGYTSGDRAALFAINRLLESYLKSIVHRVLSFARTNKRGKVNHDDVELSFFMEAITLGRLEDELLRLNAGSNNDLELSTSSEKVAKGFESVDRRTQNQLLGPELNGRAGGIPDYMERNMVALPALPPLYTHKKTAIYAPRTQSDLLTREGVTQESALAEAALRRLIELEESTAQENVIKDEDEDDQMLDDNERITNVMKSRLSDQEKQKRQREEVFNQVWQQMGYGDVINNRPVNCTLVDNTDGQPRITNLRHQMASV